LFGLSDTAALIRINLWASAALRAMIALSMPGVMASCRVALPFQMALATRLIS
jgi:hypothetical protein